MDLMRVLGQNVGMLPRFNVFEIRMATDEPRGKRVRKGLKIHPNREYKEKKDLERQTALI